MVPNTRPHVLFAGALMVVGSSGGCGDEPSAYERVQQEVFDVSCALASCHSTQREAGGLALEGSGLHEALVNAPAVQSAAAAEGLLRVVPGRLDESFLWLKVRAPLDPRYQDVMPLGNPDGLPAEQLELLESWILEGAPSE